MNSLIYFAACAAVGASLVSAGFFVGRAKGGENGEERRLTRLEKEEIRETRRSMEEEQLAFSMLIGYSPEIAYGTGEEYFDYSGRK